MKIALNVGCTQLSAIVQSLVANSMNNSPIQATLSCLYGSDTLFPIETQPLYFPVLEHRQALARC